MNSPDQSSPTPAPETPAAPAKTWEDLGLSEATLEVIRKAGYKAPTPVQAESIPFALAGQDVLASAQTGSGKTASFVLPMVEKFAGREGTFGVILSPTREIAQQTQAVIDLFGAPRGVRSIVLIGGVDMRLDTIAINTYPQIIVATPGRLCDHLDRGNVWLDYIQMVVLDEADRMLDMGFSDQLSRVMQDVPNEHQTLFYSATFPASVELLARKNMRDPKRVTIGSQGRAAPTIEQRVIWMTEESKNSQLNRLLREEKGSIIVFTRSKDGATRVWRSLHSRGVYDATYIHSDRLQAHRESALADFKSGKFRILIATDVAGRGIHVDAVAHVINYDLPMEAEDYVHRIGRTGRIGQSGKATTFATGRDRGVMRDIEKLLKKEIPAEYFDLPRPGEEGTEEPSRHSRGGDRGRRGGSGGGSKSGGRGGNAGGGSPSDTHPPSKRPAATPNGHKIVLPPRAPREAEVAGPNIITPRPPGSPPYEAPPRAEAAANDSSESDPTQKKRRRRGGRGRRGKGGDPAPSGTPPASST